MQKQILHIYSIVALAAALLCPIAAAQDFSASAEEVEAWRTSAEQGNVEAQYNLGRAYHYGKGVAHDKRSAVRWYRKAAEQGHAKAQFTLGLTYMMGQGVPVDQREAVRWWRKAAEQGDMQAQQSLGVAYTFGDGVSRNQRKAVRWYHKAAEQGDARAQNNLGYAYTHGEGVAKDPREGVRWYRESAEQGNADAQLNLGNAYAGGQGISKDLRAATRWWHKSAEQGNAGAQNNLGISYWHGDGVVTDKREAYIWWSIAKANGEERANGSLQTTNWGRYLSQSEIRSAQKEAARRIDAIERNKEEGSNKPVVPGGIASADKPKSVNIAERVFENTWRSVVVVRNGDGQGSGVIVRPNIVATNCHVVDGYGGITVYKSNDRRADTDTALSATIRQSDEDKDFCLLDVDGLWGVPVAVRKYDTLGVGEDVYGLGAPQGLDLSLSSGVISQLRQVGDDRFIQTDTAISPGSSGGGLFDSEGNLVGILTGKLVDEAAEGIGFAIPADLVLGY